VKKHLYEGLKKKGLEVKNGNSIIYDASALEEMSNNDAVVLVERVDCSLHEDMKKEIELCCKLEKNIIGTVCVK